MVELMVTLAIAAILGGIAAWAVAAALPGYRTGQAARKFLADVRLAGAIAARRNEPVHLVIGTGDGGCGRSWRMVAGPDPAAPRLEIDRFCVGAEAPGVLLTSSGAADDVKCAGDHGQPALPNCSLCADGARLTFFPTGETVALDADGAALAGHAIAFAPRDATGPERTLAVGVRAGTGVARLYRPAASAPTKWECP